MLEVLSHFKSAAKQKLIDGILWKHTTLFTQTVFFREIEWAYVLCIAVSVLMNAKIFAFFFRFLWPVLPTTTSTLPHEHFLWSDRSPTHSDNKQFIWILHYTWCKACSKTIESLYVDSVFYSPAFFHNDFIFLCIFVNKFVMFVPFFITFVFSLIIYIFMSLARTNGMQSCFCVRSFVHTVFRIIISQNMWEPKRKQKKENQNSY